MPSPQQRLLNFPALLLAGLVLLFPTGNARADIASSSGNIRFDANADGSSEVSISTTGLGIGTATPSTNLHLMGNFYLESGNLGIGTANPRSTMEISGTLGFQTQSVSSNTTAGSNTVLVVDSSQGNVTVTLPYAGNATSRSYTIKKTATSNRVLVKGGGNYIDGDPLAILADETSGMSYLNVISNGKQWYITSSSNNLRAVGSANLVGYWDLDQSSGNTASDRSGYGYDGTLGGGFTFTSNSLSGVVGTALDFDGTNDYVSTGNISAMDFPGTKPFTIAAWVRPNSGAQTGLIFSHDRIVTANCRQYYFGLSALRAWFHRSTSSDVNLFSTSTTTAGVWGHIAATFDGTTEIVYVNGVSGNSQVPTGGAATPVESVGELIGTWYRAADPSTVSTEIYKGGIDELRVYNRALSADEIKALANAR